MILLRDAQRYELTVEASGDVWVAKIFGFVPGRLMPTHYLLRQYDTRQEAITALLRKWHLLFPEEEPLVWREPAL
jgi:hypothetical protein